MRYLLDTSICIFFLKGKYDVNDKILQIGLNNCCISEITIGELAFGVYNSISQKDNLQEIEKFISSITVIPVSGCFYNFGEEKARLKRIGSIIADFDLLIGITAIYYGLTLVTHNTRHFSRLQNIKLEDWVTNN